MPKNIIIKKKKELRKRYGMDKTIYSSGETTLGEDFPLKMKINLNPEIVKNNSSRILK